MLAGFHAVHAANCIANCLQIWYKLGCMPICSVMQQLLTVLHSFACHAASTLLELYHSTNAGCAAANLAN